MRLAPAHRAQGDFFGETSAQHGQDRRFLRLKARKRITQFVLDCFLDFQDQLAVQVGRRIFQIRLNRLPTWWGAADSFYRQVWAPWLTHLRYLDLRPRAFIL